MRKASDAYLKIVEWSDEEQAYVGSAPPLLGPCCHGEDEAAVFAELSQIVEEWIEIYTRDGRPLPPATLPPEKTFSGRFVLRIDPGLHKALAIRSAQEGQSLNRYLGQQLARLF